MTLTNQSDFKSYKCCPPLHKSNITEYKNQSKVTLKVNKRFLKAFRCSCEEGPLRKAYLFLGLKNLLLHIAQQITKQSKNPGPRANQVTKLTPFSLWCVNALNGSIWSTEPPAPENPAPTPPPPHQYPPPTNFWDDIQLICFIEN